MPTLSSRPFTRPKRVPLGRFLRAIASVVLAFPVALCGCGDEALTPGPPDGAVDVSDDVVAPPDGASDVNPSPHEFAHLGAAEVPESLRDELDERILSAALPTGRPRLYGDDETWLTRVEAFENLDPACDFEGEANGWGTVKNIHRMYHRVVWGADPCTETLPAEPQAHRDAAFYLQAEPPAASGGTYRSRRRRVLFLIRRERACHRLGGDCRFEADALEELIQAFVTYEMQRLTNSEQNGCGFVREWHRTSQRFMDLGAENGMPFWSLFVDALDGHDALTAEFRQAIEQRLLVEIDSYLCSLQGPESAHCGDAFEDACGRPRWNDRTDDVPALLQGCHWSLCNGNNWTPVINNAALFWVLGFHDAYPERAARVLEGILATNWLHRKHLLDDGTYTEGPSYFGTSYGPTRTMNALSLAAFGEPIHSYRWGALEATGQWIVDNVNPDGRHADFGDAWDRVGHSSMYVLEGLLWRELVGADPIGTASPDPCLVRRFFQNNYFDHAVRDPWNVEPALARDWARIAAACDEGELGGLDVYPNQRAAVSYAFLPGATERAMSGVPLHAQADGVWLGMTATPNTFPHRELDFGGVIWTAFGHRLLYDFGYGEIFHGRSMDFVHEGTNHLDYALGANTIVIDEAAEENSYTGQFRGQEGALESAESGGLTFVHADGSAVYGATSEGGWLEAMHRFVVPLDEGVQMIVDAFRTTGRALTVEEFFWTGHSEQEGCVHGMDTRDVAVHLATATEVELTPRCSSLARDGDTWEPAESRGRLVAASRQRGLFRNDLPSFLSENAGLAPFIDGSVVRMPTRTSVVMHRDLIRYLPEEPVTEDVRVFLLVPGTASHLPVAQVEAMACDGERDCFAVTLSSQRVQVRVDRRTFELELEEM